MQVKKWIPFLLAAVLCLTVAIPAMAEGTDRRGMGTDGNGIMDMNGNNGYGTTRMQTDNDGNRNDFNMFNNDNNFNRRNANGMRATAANTAGDNDGWGWLGLLGLIGLAGLFNRNRARS